MMGVWRKNTANGAPENPRIAPILPPMPTRYRAYLPRYPTKPHLQLQVEEAVGALRCPGGGTLDVETVSSNGG